jgi:hypothetical protein
VAEDVAHPGRAGSAANARSGTTGPPSRLGSVTSAVFLLFVLVPAAATAQTVMIETGPPHWTNQTSASFRLAASEPTGIECRLDGLGGWHPCSEEHRVPGPLAEGRHVLEARSAGGSGEPPDAWTWRVDLTPPTVATIHEPEGLWQPRQIVPVSWSASDAYSGVGLYFLRYGMWSASGASRSDAPWMSRTKVTGAAFRATPGRTYCLEGATEDRAGNASLGWGPRRCFAVPLDEAALESSPGWTRRTDRDGYFRDSFMQTRERGAWARRWIVAERLVLVATRCPGCGSLTVRWRGVVIKTIDLERATTRRSMLVPLARFASAKRGWLRLEVISTGELVRIDGLGASAA